MKLHKNSDKRLDCHLLSEAETRHEMIRDVILCEAAKWVSNHVDSNDHNQLKQADTAIDSLSLSQVENHFFSQSTMAIPTSNGKIELNLSPFQFSHVSQQRRTGQSG